VTIQRIFIIWSNELFRESVRLLLDHPDIEIIGAAADFANAQDEILHLQPDTLIIEDIGRGAHAEALAILESSHFVKRIIGFSLDDNKLRVYRREEITVVRAEDLLSMVQSD
jgi:DNA-binding NarL/FixJ family response regulator